MADGFAGLSSLDDPALYVWHVDAAGAEELSAGLGHPVMPGRIYIGQAGAGASARASSKATSSATLKSRIGSNHLNRNIAGSTFRLSLAAVLAAQLKLEKAAAAHCISASRSV